MQHAGLVCSEGTKRRRRGRGGGGHDMGANGKIFRSQNKLEIIALKHSHVYIIMLGWENQYRANTAD